MNRRARLFFFNLITFLIYAYFAKEYVELHNLNSAGEFLGLYVDNFQRYFFIISILLAVFLFAFSNKLFRPEVFVRIDENLPIYMAKEILKRTLLFTANLLTILFLVCLIMDVENLEVLFYFPFVFNISTFTLAYIVFYYIIYTQIRDEIASIFVVLLSNMLILILAYAIASFSIHAEQLFNLLFTIYRATLVGVGVLYFTFKLDKVEII